MIDETVKVAKKYLEEHPEERANPRAVDQRLRSINYPKGENHMNKIVKKTKKKEVGYKKPPVPGPGRPKGSLNKFTNLKEIFLEAFEETGGVEGLIEWIKKSPRNRGQFYTIIAKMLPSSVDVDIQKPPTIIISDKFLPQERCER